MLVPLVSAGRHHRRRAVIGDLLPLSASVAGRLVRLSATAGALHRVHLAGSGVDLNCFFRKMISRKWFKCSKIHILRIIAPELVK